MATTVTIKRDGTNKQFVIKLVDDVTPANNKTVTLSLNDLPPGADVKFRQYAYCDGGVNKIFYALGTEPT